MKKQITNFPITEISTKTNQKKSNRLPVILSQIVSPAIPAFIGAGLLSGISNLLNYFGNQDSASIQA